MATLTGTLADGVGVTELVGNSSWAPVADNAGLAADCNDPVRTRQGVATEALGLALTQSTLYGVLLYQGLKLAATQAANSKSNVIMAETTALHAALSSGQLATLAANVGLSLTQSQQQVVTLAESLGLTSVLAGAATYHQTLSEAVALTASLARFLSASASDVVGLSPALTSYKSAQGVLTEMLGLAPTLTPRWLLHVELAEGIDVTATQVASMIYSGVVEEGVRITAGFLSGAGDFTTWAINTRTGAVTEYDNFVFNSFAKLGDRYIGATSTGLYELDGDDDAGADIIARLKGGFLQFGGTHLSRLKAAYIATRGETDFVLRIETGEGVIYDYAVATRSMRSTKVHMGKGQRSRYFAYELTTLGDDFDLETLEFVPIVMGRRV